MKWVLPSQNKKLQPPGCKLRKPLIRSLPLRLSPNESLPNTVGVVGRRFIGSSRGSAGEPYCAVTAKTEPYQRWPVSPQPAAPDDCSIVIGRPVSTSMAG